MYSVMSYKFSNKKTPLMCRTFLTFIISLKEWNYSLNTKQDRVTCHFVLQDSWSVLTVCFQVEISLDDACISVQMMSLENSDWKDGGAWEQTEPSSWGIHENPASGNHQAPSHWKKQCKQSVLITHLQQGIRVGWEKKQNESCPAVKNMQNNSTGATMHTTLRETARQQSCFAF